VIWVQSEATTFLAPCEACRSTRDSDGPAITYVEGRIRIDADVGFTSCWRRGHRLRVRRIARARATPLTAA